MVKTIIRQTTITIMIICRGAGHHADREYRDEKVEFFVTSCQNKMEFSYII